MGLRHLIVLDGDHRVTGIITRKDITEHRLEHHWFHEGDNMQKFINIDPMEPGTVCEGTGLLQDNGGASPGLEYGIPEVPSRGEALLPPLPAAVSASEMGGGNRQQGGGDATYSPMGLQSLTPPQSALNAGAGRAKNQRSTKEPKSMKLTK
jgi:hypothetical protein